MIKDLGYAFLNRRFHSVPETRVIESEIRFFSQGIFAPEDHFELGRFERLWSQLLHTQQLHQTGLVYTNAQWGHQTNFTDKHKTCYGVSARVPKLWLSERLTILNDSHLLWRYEQQNKYALVDLNAHWLNTLTFISQTDSHLKDEARECLTLAQAEFTRCFGSSGTKADLYESDRYVDDRPSFFQLEALCVIPDDRPDDPFDITAAEALWQKLSPMISTQPKLSVCPKAGLEYSDDYLPFLVLFLKRLNKPEAASALAAKLAGVHV
jgi:hypothetical protein